MTPSGRESSNRNETESSNQISPNQSIRCLSSIHIQCQDSYVGNDTVQNFTEEQSKNNDDANYKHRRQGYSISDELPNRRPRISLVRIEKKAWEIRAFSTCVIIVMTAVIFSGPFFASYWLEILTGTVVARQTHAYLFLVHMLNLVVDPFIYAWRIPEMKEQMKRIIKCKTREGI
ncbi:Hypothetical predicted protein [Mytilus galloprovincialis]|uniref:G-protein coupled receptors family 1 profile domain-containing protein n=1 Tax=Mytilus galloprovincialis TaxID=29158 RepID=A0A8B6G3U7_MYTGA|nr:Hypothetical predicted protein [Mytilus galloprovincialis]